jgi:hypothetical protein
MLSACAGIAILATGCGSGGEQIPLADVPAGKEYKPSKSSEGKRPAGVSTSPEQLIYK